MKFNVRMLAGAAGALMLTAGAAQAATAYDADLAPPGVYFGSGNPNGHFTVETVRGYELGLRARPYPDPPIAPTSANLYTVALGETIIFDWSFSPPEIAPFAVGFHSMTITNLGTGGTATFNPSLVPDNESLDGGYQNSWQLSYGFLNGGPLIIPALSINLPTGLGDIDYNPNVDSSYRIVFSTGGATPIVDTIFVNQGAGFAVPEPGAWALLILGFGATGAALRRRRTTTFA